MAKRKQKQTLREFKAWLQGVEELHPKDWSPNKDQWALIRDKIDNIKEEVIRQKKVVEQQPQQPQPQQNPIYRNPGVVPQNNSGVIPPSTLAQIPVNGPIQENQGTMPLIVGDGKIVTPNIDTSDGTITSPFE